jgi:AraC family transcriptional regulator
MNAVLSLSGAAHVGPASSVILSQLLNDAFEGLDGDIDRARIALSCAAALVDGASMSREAIGRGGLATWQARKILALIEASLERGVRVTELASSIRLSQAHFSRAFKAHFGRPPQRYILERRVARAQHLMLASDCRLCDVALACGFTDQAHLSRVFRHLVGTTPYAWRRARFGL